MTSFEEKLAGQYEQAKQESHHSDVTRFFRFIFYVSVVFHHTWVGHLISFILMTFQVRSSCNEVVYDVTVKDSRNATIRTETNLTTANIVLDGQHGCSNYSLRLTSINNENFTAEKSATWTTPTIGKRKAKWVQILKVHWATPN